MIMEKPYPSYIRALLRTLEEDWGQTWLICWSHPTYSDSFLHLFSVPNPNPLLGTTPNFTLLIFYILSTLFLIKLINRALLPVSPPSWTAACTPSHFIMFSLVCSLFFHSNYSCFDMKLLYPFSQIVLKWAEWLVWYSYSRGCDKGFHSNEDCVSFLIRVLTVRIMSCSSYSDH